MEVCKTSHTGSNPVLASTGEGYWWYRLALAGKVVQFHNIAGREVSHRSHKPSVLGSIPSPATNGGYSALR
jgi:(2Fe-2S) ferredoxin